jgi:hypothetical protein
LLSTGSCVKATAKSGFEVVASGVSVRRGVGGRKGDILLFSGRISAPPGDPNTTAMIDASANMEDRKSRMSPFLFSQVIQGRISAELG